MNIKCNELIEFLVNKSLQFSNNNSFCIELQEIKEILFFSNESIYDLVFQMKRKKFYYPVYFWKQISYLGTKYF